MYVMPDTTPLYDIRDSLRHLERKNAKFIPAYDTREIRNGTKIGKRSEVLIPDYPITRSEMSHFDSLAKIEITNEVLKHLNNYRFFIATEALSLNLNFFSLWNNNLVKFLLNFNDNSSAINIIEYFFFDLFENNDKKIFFHICQELKTTPNSQHKIDFGYPPFLIADMLESGEMIAVYHSSGYIYFKWKDETRPEAQTPAYKEYRKSIFNSNSWFILDKKSFSKHKINKKSLKFYTRLELANYVKEIQYFIYKNRS